MCRWNFMRLVLHPRIQALDYYCRLDTHSYVRSPLTYDLFNFMAAQRLAYGFVAVEVEPPHVIKGAQSLRPSPQLSCPKSPYLFFRCGFDPFLAPALTSTSDLTLTPNPTRPQVHTRIHSDPGPDPDQPNALATPFADHIMMLTFAQP